MDIPELEERSRVQPAAGDSLLFCTVCVKWSLGGCRYQRRSISQDTTRLGNLVNCAGCSTKLSWLCNHLAEWGRDRYKTSQLVSEMCNSVWGNEQGSPAHRLPPNAVPSNSLVFISGSFAEMCRRRGAARGGGGDGGESLSTPALLVSTSIQRTPSHCGHVDVCMHVFGRLSPSLEHTECCSSTAQRWDTFPASRCWCEGKHSLANC